LTATHSETRPAESALEVRPARDRDEIQRALDLRYRVFCLEQGVSETSERDGRDGRGAIHLVALTGGKLIGTCRLITSRRTVTLSRMAVDAESRRAGAGAALLAEAERHAVAARAKRISLHAQTHARQFYERAGYQAHGPLFVEEGIDHVAMERKVG
jgi:predicted GNAT family N-acyltransferase